jgi:hypothetical protein
MKTLATILGAGAFLLMTASQAHADIAITYQVSPNPPVTCAQNGVSSTPISCAAVSPVAGLTILQLGATSNSPGTPGLSQQFNSNLQIINNTGAEQTLDVYFSAQDFLFPTTPPPATYLTSLGVTTTTGIGSASLQSCLDGAPGGNVLAVDAATFTTACTGANSVSQTNATINYAPGGLSNDNVSTTLLSPTFSMSQRLTLVLGAGSNINVITSAALTPVPEPASIALFGTLLAISGAAMRRRFNRS